MTLDANEFTRGYALSRRDWRLKVHDRAKIAEIHAAVVKELQYLDGRGPAVKAGMVGQAIHYLRAAGCKATTPLGVMVFLAGIRCCICGKIAAEPNARIGVQRMLRAEFCSIRCVMNGTVIRRAVDYVRRYRKPLPKWFILPCRPLPALPVIELPPPPPPSQPKPIPPPRSLRSLAPRPSRQVFLPTQEEIAAAVRKIRVDQLAASRGMNEAEANAALAESGYKYKFNEPARSED